jgi:hypothetical protein
MCAPKREPGGQALASPELQGRAETPPRAACAVSRAGYLHFAGVGRLVSARTPQRVLGFSVKEYGRGWEFCQGKSFL